MQSNLINQTDYEILKECPQGHFLDLSKTENYQGNVQALEWTGVWIFTKDIKTILWRIYKRWWLRFESHLWKLNQRSTKKINKEWNEASMAITKNKVYKEVKDPFCWTLPLERSTSLKKSGHMLLKGLKFIGCHMKSEHARAKVC